jgi:hypothetical protein
MNRACAIAAALLCASATLGAQEPATAEAPQRILVMIRIAAPHFRPDVGYGGGYDAQAGRTARRRVAAKLAADHRLQLESDWPMPSIGVECYLMRVAPGTPLQNVLAELAHDPRAAWAQAMGQFHSLARVGPVRHNDPLFTLQPAASSWHLAELHGVTTGRNVLIAEIDSGVETDHPDLAGQVALAQNFVDAGPYVAEAHGTAVAGIIAARADNGVGIAGVAPNARIMALRACWQVDGMGAACNSFTLAKAFEFAMDRGADVINLSLSGPDDRLLDQLLDAAMSRGVTVVGAADPLASAGGFPASHRGVIAVSRDGPDPMASSVTAPGRDVPTTLPGARWGLVDGSSFAAAHVTGMVALLRELTPSLGPERARTLLGLTAGAPGHAIDGCALIALASQACTCACPVAAGGGTPPAR